MPEQKIIHETKQCRLCKTKETVSQKGCVGAKERGKIAKDAFTSLRKEVIPVEQPLMAGVAVECILVHYDVCAKCGFEYSTRSEIINAPVQFDPRMIKQKPPGFGPPHQAR